MLADRAILEELNGVADGAGIRESGRFILPGQSGSALSIDLNRAFRDRDVLVEEYWRAHPRFLFFKGVTEDARLIDVGAGSGGMVGWKGWGSPDRGDITMCAVDMFEGEFFDRYADFDVVELGKNQTKFSSGYFDAAIVSHLIEHVDDRDALAREIYRLCRPGAKIYVEWPTHHSGNVVGKAALETFGVCCSTVNFFDDNTHLKLVTRDQGEDAFIKAGFATLTSGEITNDYLYPELFRCGYALSDSEVTTYALWLALKFSQYLILEKR